jgi:hypothetical protein
MVLGVMLDGLGALSSSVVIVTRMLRLGKLGTQVNESWYEYCHGVNYAIPELGGLTHMESNVTRGPNPSDGISAADCSGLAGVRLLDVVRYAVTEVAPEELPLVIGLSRFDDGQITRMLARRARRSEPLGFGLGEAAVIATAIVWTAVQETANNLVASAAESLLGRIRSALRRLLHRTARSKPLPRFGPAELAEVRRRVLELAKENGFEDQRAVLLADSVVGRLALGSGADGTGTGGQAGEGDAPA